MGLAENFWRMQGLERMGKRWGKKQESRSLSKAWGHWQRPQVMEASLGRHGQKPIIQEIQFQRLIWARTTQANLPMVPASCEDD